MFREKTVYYAHTTPKKRTTATVDSVVRASAVVGDNPVDLLKIDVQVIGRFFLHRVFSGYSP